MNCSSVLIVEDDTAIREILIELVADKTHIQLETAENGYEGLVKLQSMARPVLVLLDYRMPKMDGMAFIKEVERQELQDIHIVVLTASNMKLKNYEVIQKPVELSKITDLINNHCRKDC